MASSDIAGIPAREVTPAQVTQLLRGLIQKGIGRTAARIRTHLHAAYEASLNAHLNPGASEMLMDSLLTTNPVAKISTLSDYSVPRSRALNKAELREFWLRLMKAGSGGVLPVQVRALRLALLLGGQRCEQLLRVRVEQVDFDTGTILLLDPKGRRKLPRQHLLPLIGDAAEEVRHLLQYARDVGSQYLFPSAKSSSPMSPDRVSRLVTEIRKEMVAAETASGQFQFSDLRRTAETTLASLRVSKDVRAQLQSHGLGGVQARHYDRYEYMDEKRAALLLWEGHLRALLDPQK
ncbi:MAG: tyrosine-type recombinase/integrase [Hydrogenophaga sp.]|nr:tyrosine-type recombinase/integrase [Hydrogenophaga sp.]